MAGSEIIFTLVINEDGSYEFELVGTLDHADATDHDDEITLSFGFDAMDADDDSASGTIEICVNDDGPMAVEDIDTVTDTSTSGNVLDNDDVGADDPGSVKQVTF